MKKKIMDVFVTNGNSGPLTTHCISLLTGRTPQTCLKYLLIMEAEGKVRKYEVGTAYLWEKIKPP